MTFDHAPAESPKHEERRGLDLLDSGLVETHAMAADEHRAFGHSLRRHFGGAPQALHGGCIPFEAVEDAL